MEEDWIAATVRYKVDEPWVEAAASGWPKIYGWVDDETETKVRVRWENHSTSWDLKRDLDRMSRD